MRNNLVQPFHLRILLKNKLLTRVVLPGLGLILCSCGFPSSPAQIAPTPTSSIVITRKTPLTAGTLSGLKVLAKAQDALASVHSFHFVLDNSVDLRTITNNQGNPTYQLPLTIEGEAEPPLARYTESGRVYVLSSDQLYQATTGVFGVGYTPVPSGQKYSSWQAMSNPMYYLNQIQQRANCATIIGDENISGLETTHVRLALPQTELPTNQYIDIIDLWLDKSLYRLIRTQVHQLADEADSSCNGTTDDPSAILIDTLGIITYSSFNSPTNPSIVAPN